MKHINKNLLILGTFLLLLYYIFTNNTFVASNIIDSLLMFATKVFPFLFPSIVLTNLLILNNLPYYLCKYFKINSCNYVFIMSLITGCPSNAIMIKNLLKEDNISVEEAEKVLCYTLFNNPLFLYGILSSTFSKTVVLKIIFINYLANFIIYFLLHNKNNNKYTVKYLNIDLSSSIIESISLAIGTLTMILGTITFFNIIPINNDIFKGLIELTKGLNLLNSLHLLNTTKVILASIYISFGGLCILIQIKSILKDTPIKYKYYFKYRLIHLLICIFINYIFL